MKGVWGLDQVVQPMVQAMIGLPRPFWNARALAFVQGDEIHGGLVFHGYEPERGIIEVSAASRSPKWITRTILGMATKFAYDTCQCHALVACTTPENRAVDLWRALGATEVTVPHLMGRDKPEIVFVLTDAAWKSSKFRTRTNGQKGQQRSAAA